MFFLFTKRNTSIEGNLARLISLWNELIRRDYKETIYLSKIQRTSTIIKPMQVLSRNFLLESYSKNTDALLNIFALGYSQKPDIEHIPVGFSFIFQFIQGISNKAMAVICEKVILILSIFLTILLPLLRCICQWQPECIDPIPQVRFCYGQVGHIYHS